MTIKAKPLLEDRFWIVSENGENVGTLSKDEDRFVYQCHTGTHVFDTERKLKKHLGKIVWTSKEVEEKDPEQDNIIYGYPTSTYPAKKMYDIRRKLPLFMKSEKSKSLYCAGYFIFRFKKGWVKSFCPKLSTVETYENRGPFKTEDEQKIALRAANREKRDVVEGT